MIFTVPCANGTGPAAGDADTPLASCAGALDRTGDGAPEPVALPAPHPLIATRPDAPSVRATHDVLSIPANATGNNSADLSLKAPLA